MLAPHPFPRPHGTGSAMSAFDREARSVAVLDPMCGSGTTLLAAVERGHCAKGVDIDPLAVLMTRVWTTPIHAERLVTRAEKLARKASAMYWKRVDVPWIDSDEETREFVNYWFAKEQREALRRLAILLSESNDPFDALRISLSRTIITKDSGASLARDVAHSRPHKTKDTNELRCPRRVHESSKDCC